MEEKIEDAGAAVALADQFIEQFANFRPDAGQIRRRGKKRIENRRAHRINIRFAGLAAAIVR